MRSFNLNRSDDAGDIISLQSLQGDIELPDAQAQGSSANSNQVLALSGHPLRPIVGGILKLLHPVLAVACGVAATVQVHQHIVIFRSAHCELIVHHVGHSKAF